MNDTSIPSKLFEYNEFGLLKGVNYVYQENGYVNWRAIIPAEYLYVNPDNSKRQSIEKKYGKPYNEIKVIEDKVEDKDLIITLQGIRWLGNIRGIESIRPVIKESNENYASVSCSIVFSPNFETRMEKKEWADSACATLNNTTSFYKNYLVEAATNRAFCRCVRSFLNISIVSREELGGSNSSDEQSQSESSVAKPSDTLKNLLQDKNRTFDELKIKAIKEGMNDEEVRSWKSIDEVPPLKVLDLIAIAKKGKTKNS